MPRVEPDKPGAQRRVGIEIPSTPGMSPSKETRFALPVHVATRPVSLGTHGEVCVRGEGVAPEHVFIMVREGRVFVASAKAAAPIVIERDHSPQRDQTTPARWLEIHLPCHVYVGAVSLRLFWCKAKRAEPSESSSPPSSSDERRRNPRRRVITPPPSAMLSIPTPSQVALPRFAPLSIDDDEATTQKRPFDNADCARTLKRFASGSDDVDDKARTIRRTAALPPPTPPPRRARSPRASAPTLASLDEAAPDVDPPTPAKRIHVAKNIDAEDEDTTEGAKTNAPASRPTLIQPLAADASATPVRRLTPLPAPTPPPIRITPPPPPPPPRRRTPSSEAFLLNIASRAVDAWNRFVDDGAPRPGDAGKHAKR